MNITLSLAYICSIRHSKTSVFALLGKNKTVAQVRVTNIGSSGRFMHRSSIHTSLAQCR